MMKGSIALAFAMIASLLMTRGHLASAASVTSTSGVVNLAEKASHVQGSDFYTRGGLRGALTNYVCSGNTQKSAFLTTLCAQPVIHTVARPVMDTIQNLDPAIMAGYSVDTTGVDGKHGSIIGGGDDGYGGFLGRKGFKKQVVVISGPRQFEGVEEVPAAVPAEAVAETAAQAVDTTTTQQTEIAAVDLPVVAPAPKPEPGCLTIAELAQAAGLTTLAQAVDAAGLSPELSNPQFRGTIFAPTNEAFTALVATIGTDAPTFLSSESGDTISSLLQYHVFGEPLTAAQLAERETLQMLNGDTLTVNVEENGEINLISSFQGTPPARVIAANQQACNGGIVHVINNVLLSADAVNGLVGS